MEKILLIFVETDTCMTKLLILQNKFVLTKATNHKTSESLANFNLAFQVCQNWLRLDQFGNAVLFLCTKKIQK